MKRKILIISILAALIMVSVPLLSTIQAQSTHQENIKTKAVTKSISQTGTIKDRICSKLCEMWNRFILIDWVFHEPLWHIVAEKVLSSLLKSFDCPECETE